MRTIVFESYLGRSARSSSIDIAENGLLTVEDCLLTAPLAFEWPLLVLDTFQWCAERPLRRSILSECEAVETEVVKEGTVLNSESSVSCRLRLMRWGGVAGGGGKP